jgi:hypothetical protein
VWSLVRLTRLQHVGTSLFHEAIDTGFVTVDTCRVLFHAVAKDFDQQLVKNRKSMGFPPFMMRPRLSADETKSKDLRVSCFSADIVFAS